MISLCLDGRCAKADPHKTPPSKCKCRKCYGGQHPRLERRVLLTDGEFAQIDEDVRSHAAIRKAERLVAIQARRSLNGWT